MLEIKNKISKEESYSSNVKGGKTGWFEFIEHPFTKKFFTYCINQHQSTNLDLFKYFHERKEIVNGWGNEIKKGDYVQPHIHSTYHAILYLTEGSPLVLPELNIKLYPKPGNYYFFPPFISHHVEKSEDEKNRYNVVYNVADRNNKEDWDRKKRLFVKSLESKESSS
jgi:quercetin dioxygenase-like cupin family protein